MNDPLYMTMLFDFYGELLTDKQRECFDLYHNEDLSLAELAEQFGISRQGVRDTLVRAEGTLLELEQKTGLLARFTQRSNEIMKASKLVDLLKQQTTDTNMLEGLNRLNEYLESMKG